MPPLTQYRRVEPAQPDRWRLDQNRLTAVPLDLLALLARYLDDRALQQLCRFLFDAYAIHPRKCFTHYAQPQYDALRLMLDELAQRPPAYNECVRARETRILLANEPRNFPARVQPEAAAQHTRDVVRANPFVVLFVFVNCQLAWLE